MKLVQKTTIFLALVLTVVSPKAFSYDSAVAYQAWYVLHQMEKQASIPRGLLMAMSLVETGQAMEGSILPWPYTINANTKTLYVTQQDLKKKLPYMERAGVRSVSLSWRGSEAKKYKLDEIENVIADLPKEKPLKAKIHSFSKRYQTKNEAANVARSLISLGHNNFDAGLLQVNWMYHGENFKQVDHVFDPSKNVTYAVNYLRKHKKDRDWWRSVGRYHSGTEKHAKRYIENVWEMYQKVHRLPSV
ncbi:MAG: transglycosylase SLT domain-containing protein [Pseudomonadota bacterium]|nr:transglycosylase SLT domain-containing protein [Pseudomonadota bacterium]